MLTTKKKFILLVFFASALFIAIKLGVFKGITLDAVRGHIYTLRALYHQAPVISILLFCLFVSLAMSLSIPVGNVLCVVGGAVFGLWPSVFVSALASAVGATSTLLFSRYLFKDVIRNKYGDRIEKLQKAIRKNGFIYTVALRFAFVAPYPVINWAFGISNIKLSSFFFGSLIGVIPIKFIFAHAGNNITEFDTLGEILDYRVIIGFALIALLGITFTTWKTRQSS